MKLSWEIHHVVQIASVNDVTKFSFKHLIVFNVFKNQTLNVAVEFVMFLSCHFGTAVVNTIVSCCIGIS